MPSNANATAPADYDPFGTPSSLLGVQHAYRSEIMQLDLIHLRNRDYQPAVGEFTTPDPLPGITGTTTETNPYHYADNDPTNKVDPLGLSPSDDEMDCDTLNQYDPWYQARFGSHPGWSCEDVQNQAGADFFGCYGESFLPGFNGVVTFIRGLFGKEGSGYDTNSSACGAGHTVAGVQQVAAFTVEVAAAAGPASSAGTATEVTTNASGLSDDVLRLAESHITNSGETVLGSYPGYITEATTRRASYFDIGDTWNSLSPAQRTAANNHFLEIIAARGDNIVLSTSRTQIQAGTALADEITYLTKQKGYVWVDDWLLRPGS